MERYRPTKSAQLKIRKQTRASNSLPMRKYTLIHILYTLLPVHIEWLGLDTDDFILLHIAGNNEMVTENTRHTLMEYTDIYKSE